MQTVLPKRLEFPGCLTDKLEMQDVGTSLNIAEKLEELTVCLDTLNKSVSDHASDTSQAAVQQMQGVCSDQMLKRQLQSLKASFINLGQKESFAEAIKTFFRSSDFKPEADRAAGAVESAEEDLKDLKKINQQDEEGLRHMVQTVASYHDQYQSVVARIAQRLALSKQEWQEYEASKQPLDTSCSDKAIEEEQEAALSQESARASRLESEIAAAQMDCTDTEAAVQAQLDDIAVLKAEVAQLQAIKEDQVKEADSHLRRSNEWCEEMIEVMSRTTGLSLVSIEEDCVHVRLEQEVPVNVGASEGTHSVSEEKTIEHTLSMYLVPNSSRLHFAHLSPQSVDISREVEFAKQKNGSLQLLVNAVRGKLRAHYGSARS
eukprot:CAMPEP_0202357742 /NCGR_PEP_ID=MMETSP1126-20121109/11654_1 /ASSEMBLY_ACC=CAM_ASM_000457 /TAXON_ID=3047 /ORGANISM="Dunaliella tertiolecta, Strain CCMP1320" /LENGTH=374 /DNA_ID=CAMNT_0048950697 /DNA_START=53 /DNA_END=1177 /DNA_ORIENTATION=+